MSESTGKFLGINKAEGIGIATTAAGIATFPQVVSNAIHSTAGFINQALEFGSEGLGELGGTMLGAAVAPAAGIVSGVHIGNRVADIGGLAEDAAMRKYLKWGGGVAGLLLSASPALPYMAGGAIASKLGVKPFKWASGVVGKGAAAITSATIGMPLSAIASIKRNGQKGINYVS